MSIFGALKEARVGASAYSSFSRRRLYVRRAYFFWSWVLYLRATSLGQRFGASGECILIAAPRDAMRCARPTKHKQKARTHKLLMRPDESVGAWQKHKNAAAEMSLK
jgi:hypothetical protein